MKQKIIVEKKSLLKLCFKKQDIYLKNVTKDLEPCSIELSKTDCFEENAYIDIL